MKKHDLIPAESEYESLIRKIRLLRAEVAALAAERDDLIYREIPKIRADYDAKVGALNLEAYQAKWRVLELRYKIELLQAALNRKKRMEEEEAERRAREKYAEYEEELRKRIETIKDSDRFRKSEEEREKEWQKQQEKGLSRRGPHGGTSGNGDSGADGDGGIGEDGVPEFKTRAEALRFYYRKIVKILHPDVNTDQTEEEAQLFRDAVKAFKEGDLDRLQEIYEHLMDQDAEERLQDTPDDIERLRKILRTLSERKKALEEEIEKLMSEFPYTAKEWLYDEELVAVYVEKTRELIGEYNAQYEELKKRYDRLVKGLDPDGEE
ncbi:MAG: hypothetical protein IIY46_02110 [Lachnospiraceae bacterium]|nr:hypothetical protein [Lachnospiraceae bacterium]